MRFYVENKIYRLLLILSVEVTNIITNSTVNWDLGMALSPNMSMFTFGTKLPSSVPVPLNKFS